MATSSAANIAARFEESVNNPNSKTCLLPNLRCPIVVLDNVCSTEIGLVHLALSEITVNG